MSKGKREENIRKIISMEDRIIGCNRCPSALKCIRKPSMGKGDLEPDAVLIFESNNNFLNELDNVIQIRKAITEELGIGKIYHTFLVRCQPKACTLYTHTNCYGETKLIDKDYNCILNNKPCKGVSVPPSDEQIIACLPYIVEETEILGSKYVFIFGRRVAEFMLKSWGYLDELETQLPIIKEFEHSMVIVVDDEFGFDRDYCKKIKELPAFS